MEIKMRYCLKISYFLINPMVLINYGCECVDLTVRPVTPHKQMPSAFEDCHFRVNCDILLTSVRKICVYYANCNSVVVGVTLAVR